MVISSIWPDILTDIRLFSVSGITNPAWYQASHIRYPAGYRISIRARLSGRISGPSLIKNVGIFYIILYGTLQLKCARALIKEVLRIRKKKFIQGPDLGSRGQKVPDPRSGTPTLKIISAKIKSREWRIGLNWNENFRFRIFANFFLLLEKKRTKSYENKKICRKTLTIFAKMFAKTKIFAETQVCCKN
jgi:hypothetical protein